MKKVFDTIVVSNFHELDRVLNSAIAAHKTFSLESQPIYVNDNWHLIVSWFEPKEDTTDEELPKVATS